MNQDVKVIVDLSPSQVRLAVGTGSVQSLFKPDGRLKAKLGSVPRDYKLEHVVREAVDDDSEDASDLYEHAISRLQAGRMGDDCPTVDPQAPALTPTPNPKP